MKSIYTVLFLSCFLNTVLSQVPNYVPTTGLVGWWPFDGNANDLSGNGNNGVVHGATLSLDRFGTPNKAYSFDGFNDSISVLSNTSLQLTNSNQITFSFWFKVNGFNQFGGALISKYRNGQVINSAIFIAPIAPNQIQIGGNGSAAFQTFSFNPSIWNHLVVAYNSAGNNSAKIYLNGSYLTTLNNLPLNSVFNSTNLKFGSTTCPPNDPNCNFYNGVLDDVGTWNRPLTECEIQQLYLSQLNPLSILAGPDQNVCSGTTVTLTATGANSYVWTGGVQNGVAFTPTSTQTYTVTGTDANGCTGIDVVQVNVIPTPQISTNQNTICPGQSTTLSVTALQDYCVIPSGSLSVGLIGYWPFCGNVNDESGNLNHGTNFGGTFTTDRFGNVGNCLNLNGSSRVDVGNLNLGNPNTSYTYSNWFKTSVPGVPNRTMITDYNSSSNDDNIFACWHLLEDNNKARTEVRVFPNGYGVISNNAVNNNQWHHIVTTIDRSTNLVSIYLDGVFVSSTSIPANINFNDNGFLRFGIHKWNNIFQSQLYWIGQLDDVGIWNRALTTAEIQQLYNQGQTTYSWSPGGATTPSITVSPNTTTNYTCTVTYANGLSCSASQQIVVQSNNQAQITAIVTQPTCTNTSGGAINVSVAGGVPPYNYNWSNSLTTQDISGLSAGSYSLTLTDGAGCQQDTLFTLAVPTGLSLTFNANVIGCYGASTGAITSTVSGGTPPYQYNWSNGATTPHLNNVSAGIYTLTVNDANGCTGSASSPVQQPVNPMVITAVVTPLNCFGAATGAIDIAATGATPFYSYNWNTGATSQDLQNLNAGAYVLTLTDANGCVYDSTFIVTQPQTSITTQISQFNLSCQNGNNGFVNLTVTGGTQPYTYQWNGPNNFIASTQDIFNLTSGTYSVLITDDIGCTTSTSTVISEPANPFSLVGLVTDVLCFGAATGSIDIMVSGGMAPYTYVWSNGATTQDLNNVVTGTYDVVVLDANLCQTTASFMITQPTFALQASAQVTDLLCSSNETGAIDVFVSGGTAPYTYAWSSGQTTQDLLNVGTGTYTLTITDANSCQLQLAQTIAGPAQPLITTVLPVNVSCYGFSDGQISLSIIGGQSPYSISWSTGETSTMIDSLVAGLYDVTVTDANGCQNFLSVQLTQPNQISTSFSTSTQFGCIPAEVDFSYSVNDPNLSFAWDFGNGQTSTLQNPSITYNASGCFPVSLTITATNGCVVSSYLDSLICMVQGPNAAFYSTSATIDYYTGELVLFDDSEGAIASYLWTFGDASPNSTEINPVHYFPQYFPQNYMVELTVTDTNGCIDSVAMLFSLIEEFLVFVPNTITLNGDLTNDVFLPIFSNVDLIQDYELTIFNRWGNLVFKSTLPSEAWNGRYKGKSDVQQGVYSWRIKYTDNKSVSRTLMGHLNVLK